jgi:hypothetical protein
MFSPDIFWSRLIVNRCGCQVQALQMNSQGVSPLKVLILRQTKQTKRTGGCERSRLRKNFRDWILDIALRLQRDGGRQEVRKLSLTDRRSRELHQAARRPDEEQHASLFRQEARLRRLRAQAEMLPEHARTQDTALHL